MSLPSGLRALRHPDFRRFYGGQAVSLVGTWMQSVAQAWLVLQLTGSPFKLGLIGTLQFAPMLLFAVVAGVMADRFPKRRLLLATQATLASQALVLAALSWADHVRYWHVGLLALVMGMANTLDMPARQAFVVDLVGKDDVISAVALNSAAFNAARVVGPAAAGLLIARFGVGPAFLANGLSFLVVIAMLLTVRTEGLPRPRGNTTVLEEMLEGIRYAVRTPGIALVLSMVFVVSLCVFNFSVFVPLLAREVLHEGAEGFGFLMAALGVGAVTGALTIATRSRGQIPLGATIAAAGVACGGTLGMAAVRHFWVAAPLLFVVGFGAIVFIASCNTTLQITAPDELRGRVMSLHTLGFAGSFPLGSLLVGAIAERFGVPAAFAAAGAAGLGALLAIVLWWVPRLRSA